MGSPEILYCILFGGIIAVVGEFLGTISILFKDGGVSSIF